MMIAFADILITVMKACHCLVGAAARKWVLCLFGTPHWYETNAALTRMAGMRQ